MPTMAPERWPALPAGWKETYATLHMWTQVVGKVALATAPPLNHAWGVAFQITPRGLSTRPLTHGDRTFAIEFDLLDHFLRLTVDDGTARHLPLRRQTVAAFYDEVMRTLHDTGLPVRIRTMPVELLVTPIRFEADTQHASYDPAAANSLWRIFVSCERVLTAARCEFVGKASPAHFFWGGFDIALSRFSGRPAPAREGPAFMREAYSHEVISHGFWPGSGPVSEPAFYAYCAPVPPGSDQLAVAPAAAFYHQEFGEFILPYEAVRSAADPDGALRSFIDSTYEGFAALAKWDVASFKRPTIR
jgi:hypothetical protein